MRINQVFKVLAILSSLFILHIFPSKAKAEGLLGDLNDFQTLCYDAQNLGSVIQVYQSAAATQAMAAGIGAGVAMAASILSDTIPKICNLIIAINNAKDTRGILNAASVLNDLTNAGYDNALSFAEDTLDFSTFASDLVNSKASLKSKLLNANNHRRFVNYTMRWIEPVLCRQTTKEQGVPGSGCFNKEVIRESMQLSQARAVKAAAIRAQIYSCKVDLPETEKVKKEEANTFKGLFGVGGEAQRYQKNLEQVERLEFRADQYRRLIIQMLGKTAGNDNELSAAAAVVNDLPNQFWLSMSHKMAYSEADLANPANYDDTLENGRPKCSQAGNKCLLTPSKDKKTKETKRELKRLSPEEVKAMRAGKGQQIASSAGRKYVIQSAPSIGCQDRNTQDWNVWSRQPQEALLSPFIDRAELSKKIEQCPKTTNEIWQKPLTELVRSIDANETASVSSGIALAKKDICRLQQSQAAIRALQRMESVGGPFNLTVDAKCRRSDNEVKQERKIDGRSMLTFANLEEMVNNYNSLFNTFVSATYRIGMQNNPISDALRSAGNSFNALGGDAGRNNRQSGFSSSARVYSSDQQAFLETWRPITNCDDPDYLAKRYPDMARTIESSSSSIEAFSAVIERCRADESSASNNDRAFKDAFTGYVNALNQRTALNTAIARFQVKSGLLTGNLDERRQPVCQKDQNQLALARSTAELAELQLEAMNSMVSSINALLIRSQEEQVQKEKQVEELEMYYIMNGNRLNRANEFLLNMENSRLYNQGDDMTEKLLNPTMPSTMTQQGMKDAYGK